MQRSSWSIAPSLFFFKIVLLGAKSEIADGKTYSQETHVSDRVFGIQRILSSLEQIQEDFIGNGMVRRRVVKLRKRSQQQQLQYNLKQNSEWWSTFNNKLIARID